MMFEKETEIIENQGKSSFSFEFDAGCHVSVLCFSLVSLHSVLTVSLLRKYTSMIFFIKYLPPPPPPQKKRKKKRTIENNFKNKNWAMFWMVHDHLHLLLNITSKMYRNGKPLISNNY